MGKNCEVSQHHLSIHSMPAMYIVIFLMDSTVCNKIYSINTGFNYRPAAGDSP